MKEYNFKKHKLSDVEKLWLNELLNLNFSKGSIKHIKVKLLGKIPGEFDPSMIDRRLIIHDRLTLVGLWLIDSKNKLFKYSEEIITIIKTLLINNPELEVIDSLSIGSSLNITQRDVKICFTLLSDFSFFNGGEMENNEIIFNRVHFTQEHSRFSNVLSFNNLEESMEIFYNENAPNKRRFSNDYKISTSYYSQIQTDKSKVKKLLAKLNGIRETVVKDQYVRKEVGDDYNLTVKQIEKVINEDLTEFLLGENFWHYSTNNEKWGHSAKIANKLFQIIPYLEEEIHEDKESSEITILFNSIIDKELKSRCSDILIAHSHYDRVINQSTQVLEDRIRRKANAERNLIGTQLVNKVLHTDISRSLLKLSNNPDEHEGICHICRGIMLGFRNPSHHHLSEKYTQIEALKFCLFIDSILQIIDNSVRIK